MHKEQKMKIGEWEVFDFPIKYNQADYDEARAEIVNKMKKVPDLIALFEYGCIPVPGINDIDLLGVFADNAKKMHIPGKPILSEKTRYLLKHNRTTVISEKHYRKMLYFDPWTIYPWPNGHKLLYQRKDIKRDLNFEKIQFTREQSNVLSALVIEEQLEALLRGIPLFVKKQLPVRDAFETLKYCPYLIEEIEIITGKNVDPGFSKAFKDLHLGWFEKNDVRGLIELFHRGLLVGFKVLFALADWLDKNSQQKNLGFKKTNFWNHSYLDKKYKNVYISTFQDRRVFTDSIKSPEKALEATIKSYQEIKINLGKRTKVIDFYIVFQPFETVSIPLGLASEEGLLSNNLRKDILTNQEKLPVFKPDIFRYKIKMINDITETYNKKQVIDSDAKGFLFGNHRFGYLFERERLKRKLLTRWLRWKFWRTINKSI